MSLLEVQSLSKTFGGVAAVAEVSFELEAGHVHSVIGPNGAGKTTLFNLIAGAVRPSGGKVRLDGADITGLAPHVLAERGIGRSFQTPQIFAAMSVAENVMVGRHLRLDRRLLPSLLGMPAVDRANRAARERAQLLLDQVGLGQEADRPAGGLAYGAMKRLEIARALAGDPRLLLLDEPAAGLNPTETAEITALIQAIAAAGVTVVLVEHDMRLVMAVSDHIIVLDSGRKLADGTAAAIRADPAVIAAYLGQAQ
ncbi:MAG: ABC transporter ATP-binding protein [Alphaproteobacteria bacterium]|nr:ABC transporter ATP-binding protein [Alphaproteobacteria bacterium]